MSSANGFTNTYDFENHLVSRGAVTIVYDGDGNRVQETANGTTTRYLAGGPPFRRLLEQLSALAYRRGRNNRDRITVAARKREKMGIVPKNKRLER